MSDDRNLSMVVRLIPCLLALGLSLSVHASWFGVGGNTGPKVEVLQTANMSSKVTAIGGLPKSVRVEGVSGNASVVVGRFRSNEAPHDWQIFRYSTSTGIENLGTMGKGKGSIAATCISADGTAIAGHFYIKDEGSHIFRYTQSRGLQDLGTMGKQSIEVRGISADGSVIVGSFQHSLSQEHAPVYHAFRYSQSEGFEDLDAMGAESAFANGVSADGSLIVGNFHVAKSTDHAYKYSRSDGVQDVGAVGGVAAFATGISDDGSVIVGKYFGEFSFSNYAYYNHMFIYARAGGLTKLGAMGGRSIEAAGISTDGTKVIGSYIDSNGESYVFTARIVLPVTQKNE